MSQRQVRVSEGSYSDGRHWVLECGTLVNYFAERPCPHAVRVPPGDPRRAGDAPNFANDERVWVVPYLAVAYNQGGHDCTHICAQCVAEAVVKDLAGAADREAAENALHQTVAAAPLRQAAAGPPAGA